MGLVIFINQFSRRSLGAPNNACSARVGMCRQNSLVQAVSFSYFVS